MALNPQQALFKELYTNPNSETFGNAYRSALAAGYEESYADQIMKPSAGYGWVDEIRRDLERLQKAEAVLDETLKMDTKDNTEKHRIKVDVAKFVTSRMGKSKYSERQELTGKDGEPLPTPIYGGKSS